MYFGCQTLIRYITETFPPIPWVVFSLFLMASLAAEKFLTWHSPIYFLNWTKLIGQWENNQPIFMKHLLLVKPRVSPVNIWFERMWGKEITIKVFLALLPWIKGSEAEERGGRQGLAECQSSRGPPPFLPVPTEAAVWAGEGISGVRVPQPDDQAQQGRLPCAHPGSDQRRGRAGGPGGGASGAPARGRAPGRDPHLPLAGGIRPQPRWVRAGGPFSLIHLGSFPFLKRSLIGNSIAINLQFMYQLVNLSRSKLFFINYIFRFGLIIKVSNSTEASGEKQKSIFSFPKCLRYYSQRRVPFMFIYTLPKNSSATESTGEHVRWKCYRGVLYRCAYS